MLPVDTTMQTLYTVRLKHSAQIEITSGFTDEMSFEVYNERARRIQQHGATVTNVEYEQQKLAISDAIPRTDGQLN